MEDQDFLKSLKVIEDEFLFKGRLSQEEQDALLMCNDELEFFQIISKALAQEFFDFTIAKNKFYKGRKIPIHIYVKHKEIVDNYCIFTAYQKENVVKEGVKTLFHLLRVNHIDCLKADKEYMTIKILSIRMKMRNRDREAYQSFRDTLIRSISGYYN